ncbi:glycosyltransferase family 2 protein [Mailhella massiliensis]|uniref:Glycosyltransferase family 2 protein n=1 Tax=Mailhella massiliensis TaxID=1903261 RepID=A0A921AVK7_9BACT|nr:glycosyltransferase family 2 protein [Mailhella massiliensis]HJD96938.1 glycosyltransferase family 2 protein [Mailhella massiliensis]
MSGRHIDSTAWKAVFGRDTNIGKVLQLLEDMEKDAREGLFAEKYLPMVQEAQKGGEKVFLSVLTRTQGRRIQELREVFLCLSAQTDGDFELLLVGHRLSDAQAEEIRGVIAEQPEELKRRVRFLRLDYGGRAAPLNFGFAHSRGEYVAVLDDDDIVFDHWVEEFHRAAGEHPGTVLHAYAARQRWMKLDRGEPAGNLRACGRPENVYCRPFSWPGQMDSNQCPLLGLAFPADLFRKLGLMFDESLTTTEDWDYLQRAAMLAGVSEIPKVTSIYRWWQNAESSRTVHSREEWEQNYRRIRKKMSSGLLLFPEAGTEQLFELFHPSGIVEKYIEKQGGWDAFAQNVHFKDVRRFMALYLKSKLRKILGVTPSEKVSFRDVKRIVLLYARRKLRKRI